MSGRRSIDATAYEQLRNRMDDEDAAEANSHPGMREQYIKKLGYVPYHLRSEDDYGEEEAEHTAQLPLKNPLLTPVIRAGRGLPAARKMSGDTDSEMRFGDDRMSEMDRKERSDAAGGDASYCESFIAAGSLKASVFNLCTATLGAGTLSLPYAFREAGLVGGMLMLMLSGMASTYSIKQLIYVRDRTLYSSFEDLSHSLYGVKLAKFSELIIVLFCFGTQVAYTIALGDIVVPVWGDVVGADTWVAQRWVVLTGITTFIMFPLCLNKEINALRYTSMFGVVSICWLASVVGKVCVNEVESEHRGLFENVELFTSPQRTFQSIPFMFFAFCCHVNIFSIYTELQRPSVRRIHKVVHRSFFLSFMVYFVSGAAGYLAFLDKVEGNILNNLTGADPFVVSAMVAIGIAICLAYPLNVFPARFSVEVGFWPKAKPSLVRHVLLTIVLVFGALGLAIAVPDVDVVFSVIGSTACAYVSFVLPSMLYLKVRYQQEEKKRRALFTNPHQNQARITLGDDNADDFQHSELSVSLCRFFLNPRQLLAVFTIFVGLSVAVVGTTLTVIEVINGDS